MYVHKQHSFNLKALEQFVHGCLDAPSSRRQNWSLVAAAKGGFLIGMLIIL